MSDARTLPHPPDDEWLALGTFRCRTCWQAGHDVRVTLVVPPDAQVGDLMVAMCPKCIIRPEAPLLAEEAGVFELLEVKQIAEKQ